MDHQGKIGRGKIITIIIVLLAIWFMVIQFLAAERYQMAVNVKAENNTMGVNPASESLDFGDLSRNLGATRYITLENESKKDRYILVWQRGEIADMVEINQNDFTLKSGEKFKLEFNIQIPPSAEIKSYKGDVFIFKWPKLF